MTNFIAFGFLMIISFIIFSTAQLIINDIFDKHDYSFPTTVLASILITLLCVFFSQKNNEVLDEKEHNAVQSVNE